MIKNFISKLTVANTEQFAAFTPSEERTRLSASLYIMSGKIIEAAGRHNQMSIAKKAVELHRWYGMALNNADISAMQQFIEQQMVSNDYPEDSLFRKWATYYYKHFNINESQEDTPQR
ncbi:hypothetical protein EUZ85_14330 [Hahella sp. KA22]|uniref:hypothetical protein n=1 Tax=Hahella sp. KA22 TaxID=1628392 RepID=UPI000FDDB85D|nr:hypothetical protein [Hahella sp. KA22]AZZ91843.1 hypothetical protein ENC22_11765 [Hahella sp. KA22]QAY55214.1 hypothetical protein EUZ85_14330 [Hahella sp. KA22]